MKTLTTNENARNDAVSALKVVADAVSTTLGPKGLPFIIEKSNSIDAMPSPTITKDGLTVLRSLAFADPIQNAIHALCVQASSSTVLEGGDGTTSTIVMAASVAEAVQKAVQEKNVRPQVYARKVLKETEDIINALELEADKSERAAELVALTSSNQDEELTGHVMDAISKSTAFGSVLVEKSPGSKKSYEVIVREGLVAGRGYEEHRQFGNTLSPNVAENSPFDIESPTILLYDGDLVFKNQVVPLIRNLWEHKKSGHFILCAYEIGQEVANTLAEVNLSNPDVKFWACSMRLTGEMNSRWHKLQDLAAYSGGRVLNFAEATNPFPKEVLGTVEKVTVTSDKTVFTGKADDHFVPKRVLQNENAREHAPNEFEKEHIRQRNSELTQGLVKLVIGNGHLANLQERADRADDALKAAQACLRSGALPGCGASYIRGAELANVSDELKEAVATINKKVLLNFGDDSERRFEKGQTVSISDEGVTVGSFIELKVADSFDTVKSVLRNGVELGTLVATMGGYSLTTNLEELEQLERASKVLGNK